MKPSVRHILVRFSVFFLMMHQNLPHHHLPGKIEFSFNRITQNYGISHALIVTISSNVGEDHLEYLLRTEQYVDVREITLPLMNYNPEFFVVSMEFLRRNIFVINSDTFPSFTNCKPDLSLRAPPAC